MTIQKVTYRNFSMDGEKVRISHFINIWFDLASAIFFLHLFQCNQFPETSCLFKKII